MPTATVSKRERFLTALRNELPDRVPVAPDVSNYVPARRTGLPFWAIYFEGEIPLWKAYLNATDYFGTEAWVAPCVGCPLTYDQLDVQASSSTAYDAARDAMVRRTTFRTPAGPLTCEHTCFRAEPPSPTQKLIKDLKADLPRLRWLRPMPTGIDTVVWEEMQSECHKRGQAFGVSLGYPGFQAWHYEVQGGVAPLAYAQQDNPQLLQEWLELDMERGTRAVELAIQGKPDYILFGGSGTITLASPALARKYALPALTKWSRMTKEARVPTHLHSCGRTRDLVDMLAEETDVDSINPLEEAPMGDIDLAEVKQARGSQIGLMGNLHTTRVMLLGTPELVRQEAIAAMRAAGKGGGFILSTGDQCGRDTPDENLFALVEAAHRYGTYDPQTGELPDLPDCCRLHHRPAR